MKTVRARLIAIAIAAIVALPFPVAAAQDGPGIRQTGTVASPMQPARRHLALDVNARRLLEIGQLEGGTGMTVVARNADTLRETGRVRIPQSQSGSGGSLSAVDELRHRLFVLYPVAQPFNDAAGNVLGGQPTVEAFSRTFFGVAVIDTVRARLIGAASLTLLQPVSPQDRSESNEIGIKALSFYRDGDRDVLYLASEVAAGSGNAVAGAHLVAAHQVDVGKLLEGSGAVDWSYPVVQCGLIMARETPGVLFRSAYAPTLSLPCRQGGAQGLVAGQPGQVPGIVQLRIGASPSETTSAFYPIAGNLQYGVVAADPLNERLLVQIDGNGTEAGVWIFDIATASFVGLTILPAQYAQGGTIGLAVNVARSRLYAVSRPEPERLHTSIALAATDADQADQGEVHATALAPVPVKRGIVVDPVTHRLFIPALTGTLILQDAVPARPGDEAGDPDANTLDVAEGARTAANFVGGAQAFGARVRWVGGTGGVERNTNTVYDNPPSELSPNTGGLTPPPPSEGTRDVHLARIFHATLTNGESSARATGAERDLDNTDADAAGFLDYIKGWGGPDLSSQRWPYPSVECTDFGGRGDKREVTAAGAQTTCGLDVKHTSALAVDESLSQGGAIRIAQARSRAGVARDAKRGIVAVAESEVRGMEIGGVVGIGRVLARAETWASGRPKRSNRVGAGGSFVRTFEDVWVVAGGQRKVVCALQCNPETVRTAVNSALGVRARVELPLPEPERARGTDGGFEALIVRNPFERANETAVNQESDDRRLEVPAMVLTVFADGRVPSRVVVSLAGVSTEAHYGIYLVAQPVSFRPPSARDLPGGIIHGVPGGSVTPGGAPGVNPVTNVIRKMFAGLGFAVSTPGRAVRTGAMLLVLAGPLLLLSRRKRLGDGP